jgi:hypothetical protein
MAKTTKYGGKTIKKNGKTMKKHTTRKLSPSQRKHKRVIHKGRITVPAGYEVVETVVVPNLTEEATDNTEESH